MAIHSRILHNGRITEAASAQLFAGQVGLLTGWGVFTTMRVKDGALFAWERHWARMSRDAALLSLEMPASADAIETDLIRLIEANGRADCTLRLAIVRNHGGMWEGPAESDCSSDVIGLTADLKKWGESVRLGIQPNARFTASEFAGAKILSWAGNLTWAERAAKDGYDEVVLLNEHGRVAECTSANIFIVHEGEVLTPPLSEGCLAGITRGILLEQTAVRERALTLNDLYDAEEVFITSTTRDLLPVDQVGQRRLKRGFRVRERLAVAFQTFVAADIDRRKEVLCR